MYITSIYVQEGEQEYRKAGFISPIAECLNVLLCEQICVDTVESYFCSCNEGYSLAADGRSCGGEPCICVCVVCTVEPPLKDKIWSTIKSLSYAFLTSEERTPLYNDRLACPNVSVIQRFH